MKILLLLLLLFPTFVFAEWPNSELHCLAANIYYEARGEPEIGQKLVAKVTLNRVISSKYPNTICEVVKELAQFSWYNNKKSYKESYLTDKTAWQKALKISFDTYMDYEERHNILKPMYYHSTKVNPKWAKDKIFLFRLNNHIFYR